MKKFLYKVYSLDGTALGILNPKKVLTAPSFNEKINNGQGQCSITYNEPFDDFDSTLIAPRNIVRIYAIDTERALETGDETYALGRLIYAGFISEFAPYFQGAENGIQITLLGLVSLLNFSYYKNGSSYVVSHTGEDPADIFKAIIDHFNTVYPPGLIGYSGGNIGTVGANIDYDFEDRKWLEAMEDIFDFSDANWWWRVNADGEVYLQEKAATPTHIFTIAKDVQDAYAYNNNEKIVNDLQFRDSGSGTTDFSDAPSQAAYGKSSTIVSSSGTSDSTAINQYGNKYIEENKDPAKRVKATINSKYDLESIRVGDTCRFQNLKLGSTVFDDNMQIVSLSYTPDKVTIYLEKDISAEKELEALARRVSGEN